MDRTLKYWQKKSDENASVEMEHYQLVKMFIIVDLIAHF